MNRILTTVVDLTLMLASVTRGENVVSTIDGVGQRAVSTAYGNDASIGGISSGGGDTAKHGYLGQLTETTNLVVTSTPAQVNATSTPHEKNEAMEARLAALEELLSRQQGARSKTNPNPAAK